MRRGHQIPMPVKFEKLAQYNSEVTRGLVHTITWGEQMVALQAEFDLWSKEQYDWLETPNE